MLTNEKLEEIEELAGKSTYKPFDSEHERNLSDVCDSEIIEEMAKEILSLRTAMLKTGKTEQANSPVIPDGWALVPAVPNGLMIESGKQQAFKDISENDMFFVSEIYKAMLAASPTLPEVGKTSERRIKPMLHEREVDIFN